MKHLLNTLYVMTEDAYLSLEGETVLVNQNDKVIGKFPLHNLCNIVSFSYAGASPALMGACANRNIGLSFFSRNGRFLARAMGMTTGNVLLRKEQYRISDDEAKSCLIARTMVYGKIYNARWRLERTKRDHSMRVDIDKIQLAIDALKEHGLSALEATDLDVLRGIEGKAAEQYFSVFDEMILRDKEHFYLHERNRRPPLDNVNAMLSFAYTILAGECSNALEGVGLDAYVGFLHRDRPGRKSLGLDLMEELRACMADRFVLKLINNRIVQADDFVCTESGAVLMTENARKQFIKEWQEMKKETIVHPYTEEKIPWGLVPHLQSLLLARYLRGDLDEYPPLLWK